MSFFYEFSLSSYKQGRRDIARKSNCKFEIGVVLTPKNKVNDN